MGRLNPGQKQLFYCRGWPIGTSVDLVARFTGRPSILDPDVAALDPPPLSPCWTPRDVAAGSSSRRRKRPSNDAIGACAVHGLMLSLIAHSPRCSGSVS